MVIAMKKSDNPADPFKKALTEATRAMAEDHELNLTFTADPSGVSGVAMRLPRDTADAMADEAAPRYSAPCGTPRRRTVTGATPQP
jgi:cobalamin biosynthesis protein CobT